MEDACQRIAGETAFPFATLLRRKSNDKIGALVRWLVFVDDSWHATFEQVSLG